MAPPLPEWLALLAPVPDTAPVERKPVASAEVIATGKAGPILGWQNVMVNLSEPAFGLRHVQLTLNQHGQLVAAGDHVMFVRETSPDGITATLTDHESVGGRFERDGSFRGTYWKMRLRTAPGADESETVSAEHAPPTTAQIDALKTLVDALLRRKPG